MRGQALPTEVVSLLRSSERLEKLTGVRKAGQLMAFCNSLQESAALKMFSSTDWFQINTLPERIYELLFSSDHDVAREAAFVLVANATKYSNCYQNSKCFFELSQTERSVFATQLLELVEDFGLEYVVQGELHYDGETEEDYKIKGTFCFMDRLHFKIDDLPLILKEQKVFDNHLSVGVPPGSAGCVISHARIELTAQDIKGGVVAKGTANLSTSKEDWRNYNSRTFPVVLYFNRSVDCIELPIIGLPELVKT